MKPSAALILHREEIRRIVEAHKGLNPRVFGSTLHGDETEQSDLDILIDAGPGLNLIDVAEMVLAIEELTKVKVDIKTPRGLPETFRNQVLAEALPL